MLYKFTFTITYHNSVQITQQTKLHVEPVGLVMSSVEPCYLDCSLAYLSTIHSIFVTDRVAKFTVNKVC